jgi:hypothetical protein
MGRHSSEQARNGYGGLFAGGVSEWVEMPLGRKPVGFASLYPPLYIRGMLGSRVVGNVAGRTHPRE